MDIQFVLPSANVLSDKTYRLAKLNNDNKRPVLQARYNKELAKMQQVVSEVTEHKPITEGHAEFTELLFPSVANNSGARKLKTNKLVCEKTLRRYMASKVEFPRPQETIMPVPQPEIKVVPEVSMDLGKPLEDSRMARLYHTGEIPVIQQEEVKPVVQPSPVINTPARFEQRDNPLYAAAHALVNEEEVQMAPPAPANVQIKVGEEAERLNHINELSNPSNLDPTDKFAEAMMKYKVSEKEKQASKELAMRTQEKYERVLKEYNQFQEKRIAAVNDAIRENEKEKEDYTIHSEDLTRKIQEMMEAMNSGRSMGR